MYKNGHLRVFLFEELLTYPYLLTVGVRANAFSLVATVKISNERKSVNKSVWVSGFQSLGLHHTPVWSHFMFLSVVFYNLKQVQFQVV